MWVLGIFQGFLGLRDPNIPGRYESNHRPWCVLNSSLLHLGNMAEITSKYSYLVELVLLIEVYNINGKY